ncbi:branched-chain amino acid ABC transporter permease [Bacillaceae bacterium JMAK1]|nr:branched-chain amino acid ABC transporter permease [Bacillaceae bacterium JMAK1]
MTANFRKGIFLALPLALAIATYGVSYGVLAIGAGMSYFEAILMSILVFSGSVQLVAVAMIASGASFINLVIATSLLNLRNLLYGAALSDGFHQLKRSTRFLYAFGINDESFVLSTSKFKEIGPAPRFFLGAAITFYVSWLLSSIVGASLGNVVDPIAYGLDLAFPVTFAALLVQSITNYPAFATMGLAALLTISLEALFPTNQFTIIIVGIVAPLLGLFLSRKGR